MGYNRLPITDAELVARYESGLTAAELGEQFGYTAHGILHRLRKAGAALRPARKRLDDAQAGEIERRYLAGEGVDRVATALGCSSTLVRRVLRDRDHELRPRSAYGRPGHVGFRHTEETKRQRARTKELGGYTTSSYEPTFAALLDAARIPYVAQKAIGKYSVDFALTDLGLVVEIKGPSYTDRKRQRELASDRTAFIESEGWRVVIVTPPFSLEQITNQGIPCP